MPNVQSLQFFTFKNHKLYLKLKVTSSKYPFKLFLIKKYLLNF